MEKKDELILEALSLLLCKGIYNKERTSLSMKINDFLVDEMEGDLEENK